jgi:hypothetical protein
MSRLVALILAQARQRKVAGARKKDPGEVVAWVEKYCPDYRNPLTDPWRWSRRERRISVRKNYARSD